MWLGSLVLLESWGFFGLRDRSKKKTLPAVMGIVTHHSTRPSRNVSTKSAPTQTAMIYTSTGSSQRGRRPLIDVVEDALLGQVQADGDLVRCRGRQHAQHRGDAEQYSVVA